MAAPKLVKEIMVTNLTTLDVGQNLLDAALLARSVGYRHFPVVKDGRLVGVLSDRDIHRAAPSIFSKLEPEEYNRIFETTPIEKVMAVDPQTVTPDTPIRTVVELMHEKKYGCVLVIGADKKLVGIVTTTDLLALLGKLLPGK
ncbi:MAG: CBS domain-containing protein [Terriglobia bacterium]